MIGAGTGRRVPIVFAVAFAMVEPRPRKPRCDAQPGNLIRDHRAGRDRLGWKTLQMADSELHIADPPTGSSSAARIRAWF